MATAQKNRVPHMDVPIPFITTSDDGKMIVNEKAIAIISSAKEAVSAISIVGKYRTGKSYMMNRFFNTNAGFSLGGTVQSVTKGIWIWARPHPKDPTRTLILLDTEGLHDPEKGDNTHDMKLFCLALLLSNCLVYNTVGTIDDVIIHQLHLVTELTEHIKTKENEEETGNHFSKYFPSLFLLLRDFFLELKIQGKDCSANEYMENALKPKSGHSSRLRAYNEPRLCIRAFFPDRSCLTLCKPVEDDKKLRNLDKVPESEISPSFLDQAAKATSTILDKAKPFTVDGHVMNGHSFMQLAHMYVQAINDGAIPCISSVVELVKNTQCHKAEEGAIALFDQIMSDALSGKMPVEQDYLEEIQKSAHAEALKHYQECALFDEKGESRAKLSVELQNKYELCIKENNERSKEKCNQLLHSCFQRLNDNLKDGAYVGQGKYEYYKRDRQQAIDQYKEVPNKGPMKENALNHFLEIRKTEEDAVINADKALSDMEKELARENEQRQREQERAKVAEFEQQQLQNLVLKQQTENAEMFKQMEKDFQQRQSAMMEEHSKDMKEKEQEYHRLVTEGMQRQAEQQQILIEEMKEDKKRQEYSQQQQMEEMQEFRKQHTEMIEEMRQQRQLSITQAEAMQKQIQLLQDQQASREQELAREKEQRIKEQERANAAELEKQKSHEEVLRQQAENEKRMRKIQEDYEQKQREIMKENAYQHRELMQKMNEQTQESSRQTQAMHQQVQTKPSFLGKVANVVTTPFKKIKRFFKW